MKKLFILSALLTVFCFAMKAQVIVFDFNDDTWGAAVPERSESGSFPSATINDVKFDNAQLYQRNGKGVKRVLVDKKATGAYLEFPVFKGAKKEVVVDAATGADNKSMVVEQKIDNKWEPIGTPPALNKVKETYTFPVSGKATQVRIVNPTSSTLSIYKVTIK